MVNVAKLYITPDDVREYLNVDWVEGAFSDEKLIKRIIRAMENVDHLTASTWNGRVKEIKEIFDMGVWRTGFLVGRGVPITLSREAITQIISVQVLFGNSYRELVDDTNRWTLLESGKIFIKVLDVDWGGDEIIITYRYGHTDLPENVKELTLLYVVRELLSVEQTIVEMPENKLAGISWEDTVNLINSRIQQLEDILAQPKFASQIIYDKDTE